MTTEWVLWGYRVDWSVPPIKLTGGTLAHCRRELGWRNGDGGWNELKIAKHGERPWFTCDAITKEIES